MLNRARGIDAEQKVVKGKTVLDRLGGEINLEAVVETMYQTLVHACT